MNRPIYRLYVVLILLLTLLVVFTSRWSVLEADELAEKSDNKRPLIAELSIPRGDIVSSDGELIARSDAQGRGSKRIFTREYPLGALFGHPVGFDFIDEGRDGIELSESDKLVGESGEFASILDDLQGKQQEGNDLVLTLDAGAQRIATEAIAATGQFGSVVAIEPKTGAVRVMANVPGYDPAQIPDPPAEFSDDLVAPLINRAVQSTYPPGSTMKVVTAVAALDSGKFEPTTTLNASSPQEFSGQPLSNFGNSQFGTIDMTTALTNSVNTYFAQVGEEIGPATLIEYMRRFGFEQDPELDYPSDKMIPSGVYNADGELVESGFDVARVAIGQGGAEGQLRATPMQMAQVAGAIANGGDLMTPTFVERTIDPDGRVSDELDPDKQSDVMSSETAGQVAEMMTNVAREGTASGLSVGGATFAGKTGTAERDTRVGCDLPNQVWFIGFAPAEDPEIAVAVTIECSSGFGGTVAGPIGTVVMQDLLG